MDVLDFNAHINELLDKISKKKKRIFVLGDFNVNLLKYNEDQSTNKYLGSLALNSLIPNTLQPTSLTSHSNTFIGNIFVNVFSSEAVFGNITATISDHLPQFLFIPNVLSNPLCNKSNTLERDWSKSNKENFILESNWCEILQLDKHNVNLSMNVYLDHINAILDIHAHYKIINKYKLRFKIKPWITPALQKSIVVKKSLLKKS